MELIMIVTRETKVCKLKKSLKGFQISPKRWNKRFTEEVEKLDLEIDINKPCLFTWSKRGKVGFIVLYVDYMLIGSNCRGKLNRIKQKLSLV